MEPSEKTLADRLGRVRRDRFVGRVAEVEAFRKALHEPGVVFVHGPGGVGKSALLGVFAELAAGAGRPVTRVDGRAVRAASHGLAGAVGEPAPGLVLLLDTYELLEPLDEWLRDTFLPALPAGALVVLAGRNPPPLAWRADPGWRSLLTVLPLGNLRPAESRDLLTALEVPPARQEEAVAFTRGHPLALALVADTLRESPGPFRPADAPDLIRVLLSRFVDQVPSPRHRAALEAAAHLRVTTEELLAGTLGGEDVPELFDWLRGLPFVERGPHGVYPHDLAREVLDADLRWRDPEGYRRLHRAGRAALITRVQRSRGAEQREAIFDLLFLHRAGPVLGAHYAWEALGRATAAPATVRERDPILALVERHEGADSARIARHWYERQPAAFSAYHDEGGDLFGFDATIDLHAASEADIAADPAARAAVEVARRYAPPRAGEEMIYHRFFAGRDSYQDVSPATNLFATGCCRHWVTRPRLAWSFLAVADPEGYRPLLTQLNLRPEPEAAFTVGGRGYGVYSHDWRAEPLRTWYDLMAERELGDAGPPPSDVERPALAVLSRAEFRAAVRRALRDFTRPDALAANPLGRSRAVVEGAGDLRAALLEAAGSLRGNPRDEKLYRAVHRTYLEPAATQELAAARLDLPFSTYRAHLTGGVERIAEWLWHRETAGS